MENRNQKLERLKKDWNAETGIWNLESRIIDIENDEQKNSLRQCYIYKWGNSNITVVVHSLCFTSTTNCKTWLPHLILSTLTATEPDFCHWCCHSWYARVKLAHLKKFKSPPDNLICLCIKRTSENGCTRTRLHFSFVNRLDHILLCAILVPGYRWRCRRYVVNMP